VPLYWPAQRWVSLAASINWALIRSLRPDLRTLPSTTYWTSSWRARARTSLSVPLRDIVEVREITRSAVNRETFEMISSVRPSAR